MAHSGNSSPAIYDSSCNGVWLLMKECCKEDSWGSDQTGSNGLETKVFIPSMHELGHTHDYYARKIPVDGACLAYFLQGDSDEAVAPRKSTLDGMPIAFWQRTQIHSISSLRKWANYTNEGGAWDSAYVTPLGIRPMLILNGSGLWVDEDGNLLNNRPPAAPAKLNVSSKKIRSTEKLALS